MNLISCIPRFIGNDYRCMFNAVVLYCHGTYLHVQLTANMSSQCYNYSSIMILDIFQRVLCSSGKMIAYIMYIILRYIPDHQQKWSSTEASLVSTYRIRLPYSFYTLNINTFYERNYLTYLLEVLKLLV